MNTEGVLSNGLITGHAYSITAVKQVSIVTDCRPFVLVYFMINLLLLSK